MLQSILCCEHGHNLGGNQCMDHRCMMSDESKNISKVDLRKIFDLKPKKLMFIELVSIKHIL